MYHHRIFGLKMKGKDELKLPLLLLTFLVRKEKKCLMEFLCTLDIWRCFLIHFIIKSWRRWITLACFISSLVLPKIGAAAFFISTRCDVLLSLKKKDSIQIIFLMHPTFEYFRYTFRKADLLKLFSPIYVDTYKKFFHFQLLWSYSYGVM